MPAHPTRPIPILDTVRARKTLSTVQYFTDLSDEILDLLICRMIPCHFDAGQVICLEGEPGEKVFILEKGWAKAVRTAVDGREVAAMFLSGGELFGLETVFTVATYPVTVIALENITAWAIEGLMLANLLQRYPALAMAFIRHLSERVIYYIQLVEDLGLRNVQARVARTLMLHAVQRDGQLVVPRQTWTTLDEMAIRLGTVRDVLSRSISVLEADGILRMERSQIIILNPQKLLERGHV
jgi:CRP/FNR family transcriptional regulator, cyclic AMP receptor protein